MDTSSFISTPQVSVLVWECIAVLSGGHGVVFVSWWIFLAFKPFVLM